MQKPILMGSKTGGPAINGSGARKCPSWIGSFVEATENLHSPVSFRRWAAIAAIAGALEQKVWLKTSSELYPNLYVFMVGHPGVGKTRVVRAARGLLFDLPEFHLAPTSITGAALVDSMVEAKRMLVRMPDPPLEYNSMMIAADELGAFMHQYDDEMVGLLSAFYDPDPYGQNRRGKEIKIKIARPQLNILCGTTPSNLLKFIPEGAWDQGFTSRIIMVFSDERIIGDDFAITTKGFPPAILHDLKTIASLMGEFKVTEDYRNLVNLWREQDEKPQPNHPKLIHYNTRRRAHLYKLSMVASIDKGNSLLLTRDDFNTAMNWLTSAETFMPDIFKAGVTGIDSQTMDEAHHHMMVLDPAQKGLSEHILIRFISKKAPAHSVRRIVDIMEGTGWITCLGIDDRTKLRFFTWGKKAD